MDFTIIIAHRGPLMGLWATIESCVNELSDSGFDYDFVIVVNGQAKTTDHFQTRQFLRESGKLRDWIHRDAALSPPNARQLGTKSADGDVLFFFDDHCLPCKGYFARAMAAFQRPDVDALHSVTQYRTGTARAYHYYVSLYDLRNDFWGGDSHYSPTSPDLYRIAIGAHGGFAVRRTTWDEVGGYWEGFRGWGGEESYFSLKLWLLGKQVWIDPKMVHCHFPSGRGYPRQAHDDFYRNMLMAANIIGGREWLDRVAESFAQAPRMAPQGQRPVPMATLKAAATERSAEHAAWMAQHRKQTLDEFLNEMDSRNIAH